MTRRFGRFFEGRLSTTLSESTLRAFVEALEEGALDREDVIETARRIARLGPSAQSRIASLVVRRAKSETALDQILEGIERWSRRTDVPAFETFLRFVRARATLDPSEDDEQAP